MTATINPSTGPGIPLESLRVFTPLGIRFWDLALGRPIVDYPTLQ